MTNDRKSISKYVRLFVFLILWALALCSSRIVCQQSNKPITKENLISSLKIGARERKTAAWYIKFIKQQGVDFRLTSSDEQIIRRDGSYLGQGGLDELVAVIRDSYKVIILVAEFQSLDKKESPAVTEMVINQLRAATSKYADTRIEYLSETITAQQGDEYARIKAKEHGAHFVIWGWYSTSPSNVYANVHFVFVQGVKYWTSCTKSEEETFRLPLSEIENYSLQTKITEHMTYLSLFTTGLARLETHDLGAAIDRFNRVLDLQNTPEQIIAPAQIYRYRGYAYLLEENYDAAITDYSQAITLDPTNMQDFLNRATAYIAKGNYELAIADYSKAITLGPDSADAYYSRGLAYYRGGKYELAIDDYNKAIDRDPSHTNAYYARGGAYREKGNYELAIADFTKVIKLDPSYACAYNGIAFIV